jgi:hypothetical protein
MSPHVLKQLFELSEGFSDQLRLGGTRFILGPWNLVSFPVTVLITLVANAYSDVSTSHGAPDSARLS